MADGMKRPRNMAEAIGVARKLPTYARLGWGLARDPRVPTQQKLVLGGIAAYLAFPIDVIPDFIPVIGELDDLAVLIFGLDWFSRNAPADVVDEHMARIARTTTRPVEGLERRVGLQDRGAKFALRWNGSLKA